MLKHALLALLAQAPRHGYELKTSFEETLGGTWEVNIGQIYSTLGRLERDGLVEGERVDQKSLPTKKIYTLTEAGKEALTRWLEEPVRTPRRLKNEFFVKLVFHRLIGQADERTLIWNQRQAYLQMLHDLHRLEASLSKADDPFTSLLIRGAILHTEADLNWLDECEEMLNQ